MTEDANHGQHREIALILPEKPTTIEGANKISELI